jgi:hypothetical protein
MFQTEGASHQLGSGLKDYLLRKSLKTRKQELAEITGIRLRAIRSTGVLGTQARRTCFRWQKVGCLHLLTL